MALMVNVKMNFSPMVTSPLISLSTHTTAPATILALRKHTDYIFIYKSMMHFFIKATSQAE